MNYILYLKININLVFYNKNLKSTLDIQNEIIDIQFLPSSQKGGTMFD